MLQENHDFHSPRIFFRYLLPLWLLVATSFVRCFHQSAAGHNDDIIIYYGNAMHCWRIVELKAFAEKVVKFPESESTLD